MPFPLTSKELDELLYFVKQVYVQAGPQEPPLLEQARDMHVPARALIQYFEQPAFLTALVNSWAARAPHPRSIVEAQAIEQARRLLALYPAIADVDTFGAKLDEVVHHRSFLQGMIGLILLLMFLTTVMSAVVSVYYYHDMWPIPVYPGPSNCTSLVCNTTFEQALNAVNAHNEHAQSIATTYSHLAISLGVLSLGSFIGFLCIATAYACQPSTVSLDQRILIPLITFLSAGTSGLAHAGLRALELLSTSYMDNSVEALPQAQQAQLRDWVTPAGQIPADLPVSQVLAIAILTLVCQQDPRHGAGPALTSTGRQQEVRDLLAQVFTALMLEGEQCLQQEAPAPTSSSSVQESASVTTRLLPLQGPALSRNPLVAADMMASLGHFRATRYSHAAAHVAVVVTPTDPNNALDIVVENQESSDDDHSATYAATSGVG